MPPAFCRIPLRYIQQKTGVPHQAVSQKIASEFSDIQLNGAQLRRYIQEATLSGILNMPILNKIGNLNFGDKICGKHS